MIKRSEFPLAAFVLVYLVGGLWLASRSGNSEFIVYGLVMVALIAAAWSFHRRVGLSAPVLWGLAVWGLVHMAGGLARIPEAWADGATPVLYNLRPWPWFPKFDQLVHVYGFAVATLTAWECMRAAVGARAAAGTGLIIAAVLAGMGLGALNEVVEFAATRILPETNVGGYENTGWDLVSNMVGAVLAGVYLRVRGARVEAAPAGAA